MCKVRQHHFAACGQRHVKRQHCRGPHTKIIGQDTIVQKGDRIKKSCLEGYSFTLRFTSVCSACVQKRKLQESYEHVLHIRERFGYGEELGEAIAACKQRLNREISLAIPKGKWDNENRVKSEKNCTTEVMALSKLMLSVIDEVEVEESDDEMEKVVEEEPRRPKIVLELRNWGKDALGTTTRVGRRTVPTRKLREGG